jgi:hypothetical protein
MNVLLVHGLGRTSLSMRRLGHDLAAAGHRPAYFGYRPWRESYAAMRNRLALRIVMLAEDGPYALIGHSLGGLLLRDAIAHTAGRPPELLVLLGAPAAPPRVARLAWRLPPFRWFARDAGRELVEWDAPGEIPPPEYRCLVIAGTRGPTAQWTPFHGEANDGILAVSEAALGGGARLATVRATHTFIMNHPDTRAIIRQELSTDR